MCYWGAVQSACQPLNTMGLHHTQPQGRGDSEETTSGVYGTQPTWTCSLFGAAGSAPCTFRSRDGELRRRGTLHSALGFICTTAPAFRNAF